MRTPVIVERAPTGGVVYRLPGSALEVLWPGRGSGRFIGQPRTPGGAVARIDHPVADGAYESEAAARAALTRLCALMAIAAR
jgi:hypothetical protein